MDTMSTFDALAPSWDANLAAGESWQNHQEQSRRFHWFLKRALKIGTRTKSYRLLDLGCGTGEAAWPLWKRVQSVTFFDQSAAMLRLARNKYPKGVFVRGKAEAPPFLDSEFDVIVSRGSVLSQLDPEQAFPFLQQIQRIARPSGFFLFDFRTPGSEDGGPDIYPARFNRNGMETLIRAAIPAASILAYDGTDAHATNRVLLRFASSKA